MTSRNISPKDYRKAFQASQAELDTFLQINNRLMSIKAVQQLKRGELFIQHIHPSEEFEAEWAA